MAEVQGCARQSSQRNTEFVELRCPCMHQHDVCHVHVCMYMCVCVSLPLAHVFSCALVLFSLSRVHSLSQDTHTRNGINTSPTPLSPLSLSLSYCLEEMLDFVKLFAIIRFSLSLADYITIHKLLSAKNPDFVFLHSVCLYINVQ